MYTEIPSAQAGAAGVNGGTSSPADFSGVDTILVGLTSVGGETVSDSHSNTYNVVTSIGTLKIYIAENAITSASMTFTLSGTGINAAAYFVGFSGGKLSGAEDQSNTHTYAAQTSEQPGSVTPTQDNELLFLALSMDQDPGGGFVITVDSSFESPMPGNGIGGGVIGVSWKIQTSAGAENPTMSWTNPVSGESAIATFFAEPDAENIILMGDGLT